MEPTEQDLRKYDEWGSEAVTVVHGMSPNQQQQMLLHIFQIVAHHHTTEDGDAAASLCRDLYSTISLHSDDEYRKAMSASLPPNRGNTVTFAKALEVLASSR